jgi:phosphoribosyl-AMP cyclohydrolase
MIYIFNSSLHSTHSNCPVFISKYSIDELCFVLCYNNLKYTHRIIYYAILIPEEEKMIVFSQLKFDERGLIPAIIQDVENNQVLMLAYMNQESLEQTISGGKCTYWSRSRKSLWLKGETSGHFQIVKKIYYDCDGDTLLIKVQQTGAACHTGNRSCFYRELEYKTA